MKRSAAATLVRRPPLNIKPTIRGTTTIRDIVIHIGNDFFQLDMSTCLHHLKDGPFFFNFHGLFRRSQFLILLLVGALGLAPFSHALSLPAPAVGDFAWVEKLQPAERFWEKPAMQKVMKEQQTILVSSKQAMKEQWIFKGAGLISAPGEFCFAELKDFSRLKKISERFHKVLWNEKTSQLELEIQFLGVARALRVELFESVPSTERKDRKIYFRSLGPWMSGAEGVIVFKDLERQASQLSLVSQFKGHLHWIPDFVFVVASEAVMHHVALSLRKQLETDYKLSLH